MATNRTYEVVLRAILLACLAGIIVLILGPVFVQAKVPLAVVISSGVTGGWIASSNHVFAPGQPETVRGYGVWPKGSPWAWWRHCWSVSSPDCGLPVGR